MNVWHLLGPSKAKGTERPHPPHSPETQARTISIAQCVAEDTHTHTPTPTCTHANKVTKKGSRPSKIMNGSPPYCFAQSFCCNSHIEALLRPYLLETRTMHCTCHAQPATKSKITPMPGDRHSFCDMLKTFHGHVLTTQNTPCDPVQEPGPWASW